MIEYPYFDLFQAGSVDKQWKIEYDGGTITNEDLYAQSIEISESLCSEKELRFGACEASTFKFKVANIVQPLIGKWLTVSLVIGHNDDEPLAIGRYKVASDKPTADRRYRDIVAYDAMRDIINTDVSGWYNELLPEENSEVTLKEFRQSFLEHFGISEQAPEGGLVNDSMVVTRTIEPEQISGKDVITAICEINGCFGHIGRDGKFHDIYLPQGIQGLYPANDLYPRNDLYPSNPQGSAVGKNQSYISCKYEDYVTRTITKLQIRQKENDIGIIYPDEASSENSYIVEDNFLVYGKSHEQLKEIAKNLYGKIIGILYRPHSLELAGNPCREVGDAIRVVTSEKLVESYILSRTLKGVQALRDSFSAEGSETRSENINSVHRSIVQLKGKTNELIRTVSETRSTITDVESGLLSEILQTASQIRGEIQNTKEGLESSFEMTASQIRAEVKDTKDGLESSITQTTAQIRTEIKNEVDGLQSSVTQTAKDIRSEISRTYETKEGANEEYKKLSAAIVQAEDSIKSTVASTYETKADAMSQYKELSTSITQTANSITSTVSATYETKSNALNQYENLRTNITQTESTIKSEVSKTYQTKTAAENQYNTLSSSITQTVEQIKLKVSKGDLSSEISQEAGDINITSPRFGITTNRFVLKKNGDIWTNGTIRSNGKVTGSDPLDDITLEAVLENAALSIVKSGISIGHFSARPKYEGVEIYGDPIVSIWSSGNNGYVCADPLVTIYNYYNNFYGNTLFNHQFTTFCKNKNTNPSFSLYNLSSQQKSNERR